MFNDISSPLALLRSRRSGKARDLITPGPDAAQLADILTIATRVPDHGKLNPWRLIVIGPDRRTAFAALLRSAYLAEKPDAGRLELQAMEDFAAYAPTLVALLFTPVASERIPVWEQQLSAGAVAMQLLNAAHAHGFAGNWLTGWAAGNREVARALGADGPEDCIAGFFFLGTPRQPLDERPRPDASQIVQFWAID